MGREPHLLLHGRPQRVAGALPRQVHGLLLQVQGHVPLRPHRPRHQAHRGRLRRHRLHRLHDLGRAVGDPRRDRPGVPRQCHRRALHAPHERLRQRHRRPRAAVPPLVRPQRRLPHLLHRLEPQAHPDPGGRGDDQGLQEQRGARGGVPQVAADAGVREPVERGRLGDAGRAGQDGLVQGALRVLLPQLQRHLVPAVARRGLVRQRARRIHALRSGPEGAVRPGLGEPKVHDLQLLLRLRQVQRVHLPQRVHAAVNERYRHRTLRLRRSVECWVRSVDYFCTSEEETGTGLHVILSLDF